MFYETCLAYPALVERELSEVPDLDDDESAATKYPYLPQIRAWYRQTQSNYYLPDSEIVLRYLCHHLSTPNPLFLMEMVEIDHVIADLIDNGNINPDNCPELFNIEA